MVAFFTVSKKVGTTTLHVTARVSDGHPIFTKELHEAAQFEHRKQAEHWLDELMLEAPWKVLEH